MSIERLKTMKEAFMCAVEAQMYNLAEIDAEELGEVVDMIKDLSEAIYYCEVTKAMEDSEEKEKNMMYYSPMHSNGNQNYYTEKWDHDMPMMYYGGNGSSSNSSSGNNSSYYTEKEFPNAFMDSREGRSHRSRRMYMEAKETHQDKTVQMRELEKYMQELAQDVVEMVEGASAEEKQYLSKKISALSTKLAQLNG